MKVWNGGGRLRKPAKGATLMGMLGWKEVGIAKQGIFKVQEVTKHSGPAVFDIGAEAAALDKTLKTQKNRNWKPPKTYGDIFNQLASDNGLSPAVHGSISQLMIAQHGESDMHFATRLARSVGKIGFDAEVKAENPQAKEEM
jgi:phage protein D